MSQTYRATVEGDRIRWHDGVHPDSQAKPIEVRVVALSLDAVVLSRNLRDFRQGPGWRVENWLH